MKYIRLALCGVACSALLTAQAGIAEAQGLSGASAANSADDGQTAEIIVTANKRQENIQSVGMSIQAASGDRLTQLGITDTASLQKIVPGFIATPTYRGTQVFTIRGVGFQDAALAGSPTVTAYIDEAPLPFSALTNGATLDLQRVEVLKGPQGTLFGNNATGGAINYIANKPTDTFQAGMDLSYGRFSDVNIQGFISGPLTDALSARIALQSRTSGAWQKGYGPQAGDKTGGQDFLNGRFSLLWKPGERFKAQVTISGWRDKGFNQVGQLYGLAPRSPIVPLAPSITNYPLAPHNNRAAGWVQCVNIDPFAPVAGQENDPVKFFAPNGTQISQGPGSAAQLGAAPTHCVERRRDNSYFSGTLRTDYDLNDDLTLTTLSEYQKFKRYAALDNAGVPILNNQNLQTGRIESAFQEVRLAGKWWGEGDWIIGANYEHDSTRDQFLQTYNASTASPTALPFAGLCAVFGSFDAALNPGGCRPAETPGNPAYDAVRYPAALLLALGPTKPSNIQKTNTYAIYASGEYPITSSLSVLGGVRYTQDRKRGAVCGYDGGDGTWSTVAQRISNLLELLNGSININQYLNGGGRGINAGPGGCGTTGPGPDFLSYGANLPTERLNQNNLAWKAGLNWKPVANTLFYVNVSQGYKSGAFPTVALVSFTQSAPVVQEGLLAFEGGFKTSQFNRQLTLNGALFYYDYTDKQILGALRDPVFGALTSLVNVPKSHVFGFELSGTFQPNALRGLTVVPAVSYQNSRIDKCSASQNANCIGGHFFNYDQFGNYADFHGQHFPSAPKWQASVDAEYDWQVGDGMNAFVGVNVNYTGGTANFFINRTPPPGTVYDPLRVPGYTLVDLRAGIERGAWRAQIWGRNVTNKWYWQSAEHVSDVLLRQTGMPATYGFTLSYRLR